MAKTDTDTEETTRSQMYLHDGFIEWATEEGHITPKSSQAEVVAAFSAHRNKFRKSEFYTSLKEEHAAEIEQAKADRKAAREAAAAERAAAREAAKAENAEAKPKAAKKAPAKKAAAKTTKRRGKAASTEEDNPFDD